jgi:hypothetical protein
MPVMARLIPILSVGVALLLPAGTTAKVGALTQLKGKAGCLKRGRTKGCVTARFGGGLIWDMAVSPDGRNVYTTTVQDELGERL